MFKQGDSSSRQKNDGYLSKVNKFYRKNVSDICLNTEKHFFVEVLFWNQ